jgi:hypothetical protein
MSKTATDSRESLAVLSGYWPVASWRSWFCAEWLLWLVTSPRVTLSLARLFSSYLAVPLLCRVPSLER